MPVPANHTPGAVITAADVNALAALANAAQPGSADLTTIAGLSSGTAGALVTDGSGWIRKTYAQLKTALGLVKADVGLGNVDNTADTAKPVSTAQQTALDLKAPLASPAFTGTPTKSGSPVLSQADAAGAYVPFVEVVNTVAASGAAQSLPLPSVATMNDITLTANCTLTLPTPTKGGFVVLLRQDATGSRVPSWSGSVIWDGNAAPTQSSGAGTATEYVFESFSGTNWRGKFGGSYPS